jgi:hypothetical protein
MAKEKKTEKKPAAKAPKKDTKIKKPKPPHAPPKPGAKAKTRPPRSNGKHAGGRPTKYNPELYKTLPDMFKDGQSIVEVCVELGISISTYYNWEDEYPEFLEASTRGKLVSRAWWERMGRENLYDESEYDAEARVSTNKKFNDRLWSKNVGCRFKKSSDPRLFDWTDKQEVGVTDKDGNDRSFTVTFTKPKE